MTCQTLMILLSLLLASTSPFPSKRHSGRVLLMVSKWVLVFDDMRIFFHGGMTAGEFFDRLERKETSRGTRFFLDSAPVSSYPETLDVQLFAGRWSGGETPLDKRHPGTAAGLMNALEFKVEWKRGMSTRPAAKVTIKYLPTDETAPNVLWKYEFIVSSEGVPLTDHLIVSAYGPDSSLVARFSAAP
jgi:hypothetical protein